MVAITVIVVGAVGLVSLTLVSEQREHPIVASISSAASNSSSITSTNNTTSVVCVINVEGSGTYLHIISDSSKEPLPAISVQVTPEASSCLGFSKPGPSTYVTNASGWISVGGLQANYYFDASLVYAGRDYSFSLPQGPLDTTNATLGLPSGNLTISLCNTMATTNPCRPYTQSTTISTSGQESSSTCLTTFPGQPLGAFIRIVNDSTSGPVVGANVTAIAPVGGTCSGSTGQYSTVRFTTNDSGWYSLPVLNSGTYQIAVTYLGRTYALTLPLGLSIYNCGTLYLPSGRTNVTTSIQTSCASR